MARASMTAMTLRPLHGGADGAAPAADDGAATAGAVPDAKGVAPASIAPLELDDMAGLLRAIGRACPDRSSRIIQVIASDHGDGVSTIAGGLAYAACVIDGARALVCDATPNQDLLRKTAASAIPSLFDVVDTRSAWLSAITPMPGLYYSVCNLIGAGGEGHPAARADRMAPVLDGLRGDFEWIFIDSPPALEGVFGPTLGRLCDGSILVARTGGTRRADVSRAERAIDLHGGRVLGVVLNKAPAPSRKARPRARAASGRPT